MAGLSRKAQRAALLGASGSLRHFATSHPLPRCNCWEAKPSKNQHKSLISLVPVERIELPTFGLQNRCSTAELNRRIEAIGGSKVSRPLVRSSAAQISDLVAKGQNLKNRFDRSRMEKAAFPAAFSERDSRTALLAEMPPTVLAAEQGAGDADKPVAAGVVLAAERIGGNRRRRADRTADDAGRDIGGPEAAVVVSAIVAVLPGAIPIGLI